MPRILVCDPLAAEGLEVLRGAGSVVEATGLDEAGLCQAVADADAVVVRSQTRVTAAVIGAGKRLAVIARAGVGVDNIDVEAATRRGVYVVNSPGGNTVAAAEHTIAMLLAAARNIPQANAALRAGRWSRSEFTGRQIAGKTLGIVGLGRVGGEVARRAAGLGANLIAHDPYVGEERAAALGARLADLGELLATAPFVVLCPALTPETHGLIGEAELALMRGDAILINCSRGGVVSESALLAALRAGQLAGAALDVFEDEPPGNADLIALPNVVATPHLGASTEEAQVTVAVEAAQQVADVLAGRSPRWPVNVPRLAAETEAALQPHFRLLEAMTTLLGALAGAVPTRVELTCGGDLPGGDVAPLMRRLLAAVLARSMDEDTNIVSAPAVARERGIATAQAQTSETRGHAHLITATVVTASGAVSVAGTLAEGGEPRLVAVDGFTCDLPATGDALLVWSAEPDRPGVVGQLGTILGEAGVSIRGVSISPDIVNGRGLLIVTTAGATGETERARAAQIPGIAMVRSVSFGS